MKRRDFLGVLGGAAAAFPLAARAQQPDRMRRIGVLMDIPESDPLRERRLSPFLNKLRELGWTVGRDLRIDYRWLAGDPSRAPVMASELVALRPDAILSVSGPALAALQRETQRIPIVFLQVGDPVASGYVTTLARPGGNITGFTTREAGLGTKWLGLLKEIAPHLNRVGVMLHPTTRAQLVTRDVIESAGPTFGLTVTSLGVQDAPDIVAAMETFARTPNGGLIVMANPVTTSNRERLLALAEQHRLPALYALHHFVVEGGLISYSTDPLDQYGDAAAYIDRILKGAKPADLPVQQPTKYRLVINLKTAKALGLTVPPMLLGRADEVIE
jgi:putative ABC transport system substrate-binding protein